MYGNYRSHPSALVGVEAESLAGDEIDGPRGIEVFKRGRVHTRLVSRDGGLSNLPDNVGSGGIVRVGEDDGGTDHVVHDVMEVGEGEVGDVEADVVRGAEQAAALGGVRNVEFARG